MDQMQHSRTEKIIIEHRINLTLNFDNLIVSFINYNRLRLYRISQNMINSKIYTIVQQVTVTTLTVRSSQLKLRLHLVPRLAGSKLLSFLDSNEDGSYQKQKARLQSKPIRC